MQLHHLGSKTTFRSSKRVGRGGKRGTYSGRGIKGLGARAGGKFRPEERDILKRIPKLRGYRFKSYRAQPAVVNLSVLEKNFKSGDIVSPDTLLNKRLVRRIKGKTPKVKILGTGELKKKLIFKDVIFSGAAAKKKAAV